MLKKAMAVAAVAASVVGATATAAPQALAIGNDSTSTVNGNGAEQVYGNGATKGAMSPQLSLAQGDLNKLCVGLPVKGELQSLIGVVNVGVQDIPVLSAPQNQQCAENSTQAKGDEPLSHIADNIPVLSGNGASHS
jgi:hypothetical protein